MNVELKPIAESKIRQLGGDVCGVLVRKDDRLAAVDEHGRVQWLQSGQGVEPVALLQREIGESTWFDHVPVKPNTREAEGLKASPILDYCEVYTHPQPAQQGSVPKEWRLRILSEFPLLDDDGLDQEKHHCEWSIQQDRKRLRSMLADTPRPEGDGWIAVPRGAVEYLKDQWPGAYARFYEKVDELKRPQPPKEGE